MRLAVISLTLLWACGGDSEPDPATDASTTTDTSVSADGGAGASDGAPSDGSAADAGDASVTDAAVDTTPAPTCSSDLAPGASTETIDFDGQTRTYNLMIPTAHDGTTPLPLVFDIHGYTESAEREESRSHMQELGEAEGFIVVQPEGSGILQSWNAGLCCGTAEAEGIDDVGLIRAIASDVASRACVDLARVYATGLSNGGFLSHRLACEASDLFAAVAPVAAVLGVPMETCTPDHGVGVMEVNGTSDPLVPYDGNAFLGYPSAMATIDHWLDQNDCTMGPDETLAVRRATCQTWSGCRDDVNVVLCTIERGGHEWPPDSSGLSTSAEIWRFFQRHSR